MKTDIQTADDLTRGPAVVIAERRTDATKPQRLARGALALGLVLLGIWTLQNFLPALVWAAVFAIALWPFYQRMLRRWPSARHSDWMAALFTLAIALLFIVPFGLIAMQFGREASASLEWINTARHDGVPVPDMLHRLPVFSTQAVNWWQANLADPKNAAALLHRVTTGGMGETGRHVGSQVAHRLVLFGFTLLTLFFLFRDGDVVSGQMLVASRRAFGAAGERIGRQIIASVHGTVDGLVLVGLGEGVILGVAYAVAGVTHPTLLGVFTAVAAMVPFGAPIVFMLAAALALFNGSTVAAIAILVLGFITTFVADHFVRPVLIGGATRLPFLWVLFGILGGVEVWGLLGLFLGPAIMAALILLWREWTAPRPDAAEERTIAVRPERSDAHA